MSEGGEKPRRTTLVGNWEEELAMQDAIKCVDRAATTGMRVLGLGMGADEPVARTTEARAAMSKTAAGRGGPGKAGANGVAPRMARLLARERAEAERDEARQRSAEGERERAEAERSRFEGVVHSRRNVLLESDEPGEPLGSAAVSHWAEGGANASAGGTFKRNSGFTLPAGLDPVGGSSTFSW